MMIEIIHTQFEKLQSETDDLYKFLNTFRDWLNRTFANYEIHLEDHWSEEKTIIEYILKSMDTFNILVLAKDEYENMRDERGVWHLGDYVTTSWQLDNAWKSIEDFIQENGKPCLRQAETYRY